MGVRYFMCILFHIKTLKQERIVQLVIELKLNLLSYFCVKGRQLMGSGLYLASLRMGIEPMAFTRHGRRARLQILGKEVFVVFPLCVFFFKPFQLGFMAHAFIIAPLQPSLWVLIYIITVRKRMGICPLEIPKIFHRLLCLLCVDFYI